MFNFEWKVCQGNCRQACLYGSWFAFQCALIVVEEAKTTLSSDEKALDGIQKRKKENRRWISKLLALIF